MITKKKFFEWLEHADGPHRISITPPTHNWETTFAVACDTRKRFYGKDLAYCRGRRSAEKAAEKYRRWFVEWLEKHGKE